MLLACGQERRPTGMRRSSGLGGRYRGSTMDGARLMKKLSGVAKRPESMLAVSVVGLALAVAVLLNLTLASCGSLDVGGGSSRRPVVREEKPAVKPGGQVRTPVITPGPIALSGEPEMRVRIMAGIDSLKASAPQGLVIGPGETGGQPVRPAVTITIENGDWVVSGAAGVLTRWPAASSSPLWVSAGASGPAGAARAMVTLNGTVYPGRFRLSTRTDIGPRAFDVVEFVGIEDYLPGVVQKEMLPNWPLAAYQVQAVAARTYALQERERSLSAREAFDLEATDRDQVYSGVGVNRLALEAVRSTAGQVVTFQGGLLRAYYSSTCGGRTASARDTWPTGPGFEYNLAAPIQAKARESACNASPLYRWQVTRPKGETVRRLVAFGERNGVMVRRMRDLAAIEVMQTNDDGRPSRFKIVEPGGAWYQLSGEELRLAFNTPAPGLPEITRATRVASSDIEVAVRGNQVVVKGRGFGHGVGMCQYCTRAFADRGEDWRTIIARFYPGASLEKRY